MATARASTWQRTRAFAIGLRSIRHNTPPPVAGTDDVVRAYDAGRTFAQHATFHARRGHGFGPTRWDAFRRGQWRAIVCRHDVTITTLPSGSPNGWHCTRCPWATDELF